MDRVSGNLFGERVRIAADEDVEELVLGKLRKRLVDAILSALAKEIERLLAFGTALLRFVEWLNELNR